MQVQSIGNVVASELATPEIKNKVALKAALRPMRSEPAGQKFRFERGKAGQRTSSPAQSAKHHAGKHCRR